MFVLVEYILEVLGYGQNNHCKILAYTVIKQIKKSGLLRWKVRSSSRCVQWTLAVQALSTACWWKNTAMSAASSSCLLKAKLELFAALFAFNRNTVKCLEVCTKRILQFTQLFIHLLIIYNHLLSALLFIRLSFFLYSFTNPMSIKKLLCLMNHGEKNNLHLYMYVKC